MEQRQFHFVHNQRFCVTLVHLRVGSTSPPGIGHTTYLGDGQQAILQPIISAPAGLNIEVNARFLQADHQLPDLIEQLPLDFSDVKFLLHISQEADCTLRMTIWGARMPSSVGNGPSQVLFSLAESEWKAVGRIR
jgi:hypothetical protein